MRRNLTYGLLLAILGGACIVSAPAGAETYKWVDAEGKIHYTDQPPPANAKELGTLNAPKPPAAGDGSARFLADRSLPRSRRPFPPANPAGHS